MRFQSRRIILLTGAGFTHNLGTPLATDIWYSVFNHEAIQKHERIRDILQTDFDFESVYQTVMEGSFEEGEKQAIQNAIEAAFHEIDSIIRGWTYRHNAPCPVNIYKVWELLNRFAGMQAERGFIFTLNQDLFLERKYWPTNILSVFGVRQLPDLFTPRFSERVVSTDDYCSLPNEHEIEELRNVFDRTQQSFFYVKLHGSQNWLSSDGARKMVLGGKKREQIEKEPILRFYFDVFQTAITQGDRHLLVIGYGFLDEHVNELLQEAIAKTGLRLHVLSPQPANEFHQNVVGIKGGEDLLKGLSSYFRYDLLQLCPTNQSVSIAWRNLEDKFFKYG